MEDKHHDPVPLTPSRSSQAASGICWLSPQEGRALYKLLLNLRCNKERILSGERLGRWVVSVFDPL